MPLELWQPRAERAESWLVRLRWGALLGMALTIVAARAVVPGLALSGPLAVLVAIALVQVGWILALRARGEARHQEAEALPARSTVGAQLSLDVLSLAAMLWVTGGTTNPFVDFVTFQIAIAGLVCPPRVTLGIAALALGAVLGLTQAPPLELSSARWGAEATARAASHVALAAHGAILGFFVYMTARRIEQLRDEAGRNEKLAILGKLVGGMCHELGTPIATILLAGKDLAESDLGDPELSHLARTVAGEAQRASEIIGLLRGQIRPDPSTDTVEARAFVREIADAELDRAGFRGERSFPKGEPVTATVLTAAVRQIVSNAVRNAAEALREVEGARVEVRVRASPREVVISVEDNGPGFSPEVLARLGEPFQTTKPSSQGLGLGLYTSSMIAERVGASLRVESGAGQGARVVLALPRRV